MKNTDTTKQTQVEVGSPCRQCKDGTYKHLGWQDERDGVFVCPTCWHHVYQG